MPLTKQEFTDVELYLMSLSEEEMDKLADELARFEEGLIEDQEPKLK